MSKCATWLAFAAIAVTMTLIFGASLLAKGKHPRPGGPPAEEGGDPPEVTIGERLFLETRFAEFFASFVNVGGDVNAPLLSGDPVVDFTMTTGAPLPGPFAGTSINCRACHLVDEQLGPATMRTYGDFSRQSPIPERGDGHTTTPRNSPPLVNASLPRDVGLLLHFDGEFASLADLVKSTFTGRNFGWLPRQSGEAIAHIARVIRLDDGSGSLAQDFGGLSYRDVLTGTSPAIPDEFKLPPSFRVNVARASNQQIVDAVAKLVAAYTEQLEFSRDDRGFNLSPFDVFLAQNGLPRQPAHKETDIEFSRRLLKRIGQLEKRHALTFVEANPNTANGQFEFHDQPFRFGTEELQGLKIFFAEASQSSKPSKAPTSGVGNCVACHAAPTFTDFRFHNTGVTQIEYDTVHGATAFEHLLIPGLAMRVAHHDEFLPATPEHPDASGRFRMSARAGSPELTDLGLWNVFLNPDFPKPQAQIWNIVCDAELAERHLPAAHARTRCSPAGLLSRALAEFKTAGLRDLSHSGPYMHNGQFNTLADVIELYRATSTLMRASRLRNGDAELRGITLAEEDVLPLSAFLHALNEDYQ